MTAAKHERNQPTPSVETARQDARQRATPETNHPPVDSGGEVHRVATARNNLTLPRSPLLGREHELATIQHLLLQEHIGLLTLTGPGGIGKTRLAMQVAANLLDHFVDGVYFVSLAPISNPELVASAIAQTLGVREAPGRSIQDGLQEYLRDKQQLLVLDNFEQILSAAPLVSTLLTGCPCLKVLVTSRAAIRLYGEQEFPVPPLALPDAKQLTASLVNYAAIDLFCQRARAVKPDFTLTPDNAVDVAKLCIGLDGLPLALELAAARIKLFSPSALLARLNQRLTLLTDGPHDLPVRQRTLRGEIAWSYDLLTASEQTLFRRLAVFVGGFTLEAAQAVGNVSDDLGINVLDGVALLVDRNLLKQLEQNDEGEPRFGMLETIQEYGLEQLAASSESETIRRHHASFFLTLAEDADAKLRGPQQLAQLRRLDADYPNLQVVLAWSLQSNQNEKDHTKLALGLRLISILLWFWQLRTHLREGRAWCEQALSLDGVAIHEASMAKVLYSAGLLALSQGAFINARAYLEKSLLLGQKCNDKRNIASTLDALARVVTLQGDPITGQALAKESVALFREFDDKWHLALALSALGFPTRSIGDYEGARRVIEESVMLFRAVGDIWGIAEALSDLASVAQLQGDYVAARAWLEEALALRKPVEDKWLLMSTSFALGKIARWQDDHERAMALFTQSLILSREMGAQWYIALACQQLGFISLWQDNDEQATVYLCKSLELYPVLGVLENVLSLIGAIAVGASRQQWEQAAQLCGAIETLCVTLDRPFSLMEKADYTRAVALIRDRRNEPRLATAWIQGQTLTLEQAIQYAAIMLKAVETIPATRKLIPLLSPPPIYPAGLTAREVEILRLLAQGLTYAQIAEQLIITRRTVNAHLTTIYDKLGVHSRAAATRFAMDNHLL